MPTLVPNSERKAGLAQFQDAVVRRKDVQDWIQKVNYYVDPEAAGTNQLTRAALEGMFHSLDPHSEFLTTDAYRELREEMDGKFGGIGVQVERRAGKVVVIAPVADGPGERAGVLRGASLEQLVERSERRQRRAKLVRDVGQELAAAVAVAHDDVHRLLHLSRHGVELARQLGDFGRAGPGAIGRHAPVQVALRQCSSRLGQPPQWRGEAASQQRRNHDREHHRAE